jgi:4-hydroxybenzoate polyprenyltransferase
LLREGLGFITAICIASANYAINEWLDRDFDKFHPTKSRRGLIVSVILLTAIFAVTTFVNIPLLDALTSQQYINLQ